VMGDRMRFVFRNFPLAQMHPHAEHAAEAAETAGSLGKFWEMHDTLYENQRALDDPHLVAYAERVGVDAQAFIAAMQERRFASRVRDDFQSGMMSGVNGTPTFYINGVRHDDSWDVETLLAAIERAAG
jgi:protein-disulfide isomerase